MKLYYNPISTTSRSVMLFAADNDLQLDYQFVDLMTGEQQQPEFTAINANQLVPVLEDGDFRLTESSAILKYLADQIDSPAYPADPRQRARVNERMDWFNTGLSRELNYGVIYLQILPNHRRPDEHIQAQTIAWARQRAMKCLGVLDRDYLASHSYVCGPNITLADYLGIAMVTLGETIHLNYAHWPNVQRWIARMKDRQVWSSVNAAFYEYMVKPYAGAKFVRI